MSEALLIGVDEYTKFPWSDLRGSLNDVEDWSNVCARVGFSAEVLVSPRASGGVPVPDRRWPYAARANRSNTVAAITNLLRQPGVAMLVFSGHGWHDDKGLVLCMEDFEGTRSTTDEAPGGLTFQELGSLISNRNGSLSLIVVLDCCYGGAAQSGAVVRSLRDQQIDSRSVARALQELVDGVSSEREAELASAAETRQPVVVLAAADTEAVEYAIAGRTRSVFTWAATSVLSRWNRSVMGPSQFIDLSYSRLVDRTAVLLGTLYFEQNPRLLITSGHASKAAWPTLLPFDGPEPAAVLPQVPPLLGWGKQISGGESGIREVTVEALFDQTWVPAGQIRVTVYGDFPHGHNNFELFREYWEIKKIALGQRLRLSRVVPDLEWSQVPAGATPFGAAPGFARWTIVPHQVADVHVTVQVSVTPAASQYLYETALAVENAGKVAILIDRRPGNLQSTWFRGGHGQLLAQVVSLELLPKSTGNYAGIKTVESHH